MNLDTIIKIKSNPNLQRYIKENSYWFKILNRNVVRNKVRFVYEIDGLDFSFAKISYYQSN